MKIKKKDGGNLGKLSGLVWSRRRKKNLKRRKKETTERVALKLVAVNDEGGRGMEKKKNVWLRISSRRKEKKRRRKIRGENVEKERKKINCKYVLPSSRVLSAPAGEKRNE